MQGLGFGPRRLWQEKYGSTPFPGELGRALSISAPWGRRGSWFVAKNTTTVLRPVWSRPIEVLACISWILVLLLLFPFVYLNFPILVVQVGATTPTLSWLRLFPFKIRLPKTEDGQPFEGPLGFPVWPILKLNLRAQRSLDSSENPQKTMDFMIFLPSIVGKFSSLFP